MYGISFLIDNTQLGLVATDRDKNIIVYMFQPQSKESFGGSLSNNSMNLLFNIVLIDFFCCNRSTTDSKS